LVQSHIFRNISSVSRTVAGLEETASSLTDPVLLLNQVHMHHQRSHALGHKHYATKLLAFIKSPSQNSDYITIEMQAAA
jgi:hypothetical protein